MPTAGKPTSTQRALALLNCFSTATPALTLSELARRRSQPVSSTHRQVAELIRWGALERRPDGRYQIGLHLWEVGSLAPRSTSLREAAVPFLEDLYEVTHENCQVAVLDGDEVVYVERIYGHQATRIPARPGFRLPLYVTGVGRVLLAHAGPELVNQVLAGPLRRFTRLTTVDPAQLRRELAKVRRTGYAISAGQLEETSTSVAAPIHGPGHTVVAALSIIGTYRPDRARRYVPAVLTAARGISRTLGG